MGKIGVAHLVREQNGIQPFARFLDSYARFLPGAKHDLLIIFKGFRNPAAAQKYYDLLKPFHYEKLFVSDLGFDLRAYSLAAQSFDYSQFCFLNSFSVILDSGWLDKMLAVAAHPEIGLVGATGSYESMYTNLLSGKVRDQNEGGIFPKFLGKTLRLRLNRFFFYPFPNHHIRTTAFILSRQTMLKIWPQNILTKKGAYLFENGKNNLTQRVMRMNLKVLIVGRDGRGYEKDEWAASNTYRQANQENLLVADNQTARYASADFDTRNYLSTLAWGNQANPARP